MDSSQQLAVMEAVDAVVTPDPSSAGSVVPLSHDQTPAEQQSPLVDAIVPCTPRKQCVAKGEIGWLYSSMVLMQSNQASEQLSPRRSARQLAEMLRREPVGVVNSPMLPLPALTFPSLDAPVAPEGEAPEVVRARERAARARAAAPAKAQAAAAAAAAAAASTAAAAAAAKLAQSESCCKASASNCNVTPDAKKECSVTSTNALPSPTNQSPAPSPDAGQRRRVNGKQRDSPCQEVFNMELSHADASTTANCMPSQRSKTTKEAKSSPKPSDNEEVATPALKQQAPRSHNQAGGRGAAAKKRAARRDDAQEFTQAQSSQKKADKQKEEQEEAPVDMGDATNPAPPAEVEEQVSTPPKRGRKRPAPPSEQIANSAKPVELDNTNKQSQGDARVEPTRVSQRARKQRTLQVQHLLSLSEKERGKFLQGLTLAQQMRIAKEMSLAEAGG